MRRSSRSSRRAPGGSPRDSRSCRERGHERVLAVDLGPRAGEAVVADARRMGSEERMRRGRLRDRLLDPLLQPVTGCPGKRARRHESVHSAATVDGQSPPRMTPMLRLIGCANVVVGRRARLSFSSASRRRRARDDRERRLDRVRALLCIAGVRRRARDVDVEPEHADLRDRDRRGERLGDHTRVRPEAADRALERAVAGALLLDDRLQLHRRERREPEAASALHGARGSRRARPSCRRRRGRRASRRRARRENGGVRQRLLGGRPRRRRCGR